MHMLDDHAAGLDGEEAVFTSRSHPDTSSLRWAFAGRLVRPLAVCFLPLMVGALVAVLQSYPVLGYLTLGFPAALTLASAWTLYRMQSTVAEIRVRPGAAAVRSVWRCAAPARRLRWLPILEIRESPATITLGLGDAAYELDRDAWPEADHLVDALRAARTYVYS